jgi:hypothetical protein
MPAYEMNACKIHAYEVAYGRGTPMREKLLYYSLQ